MLFLQLSHPNPDRNQRLLQPQMSVCSLQQSVDTCRTVLTERGLLLNSFFSPNGVHFGDATL